MTLQYILLGFLNYRSQTGYELKQLMDKSTSHFWYAKQSQIYTTLKKMEREGWIISRIEPQKSRPDRVVYKITKSGLNVLEGWISNPIRELDLHKNTLLVKLFFSAREGREAVLTQLRLLRNLHQRNGQLYKTQTKKVIEEFVARRPKLKKDALLWETTRRFGELHEEMVLHWLDETIAMVEKNF